MTADAQLGFLSLVLCSKHFFQPAGHSLAGWDLQTNTLPWRREHWWLKPDVLKHLTFCSDAWVIPNAEQRVPGEQTGNKFFPAQQWKSHMEDTRGDDRKHEVHSDVGYLPCWWMYTTWPTTSAWTLPSTYKEPFENLFEWRLPKAFLHLHWTMGKIGRQKTLKTQVDLCIPHSVHNVRETHYFQSTLIVGFCFLRRLWLSWNSSQNCVWCPNEEDDGLTTVIGPNSSWIKTPTGVLL